MTRPAERAPHRRSPRTVVVAVAWLIPILMIGWAALTLTARNARLAAIVAAPGSARPGDAVSDEWLSPKWYVDEATSRPLATTTPPHNTLLVFAGNACAACDWTLKKWLDAAERQARERRPDIRVVVPSGALRRQIERVVEARAIEVTVLTIRDPDRLECALGVRSVPLSLLVSPAGALRVVVAGVPSDRTVSLALAMPALTGSAFTEHGTGAVPFTSRSAANADWSRTNQTTTGGTDARNRQ